MCALGMRMRSVPKSIDTVLIHNGNVLATRIIMRAVNLLKRIRSKGVAMTGEMQSPDALISVIVPVYKLKQTLDRCVEIS